MRALVALLREHVTETLFALWAAFARVDQVGKANLMQTFEERHAQVDPDPLKELIRRCEMWAMAPDSRGQGLFAQIIPKETLRAAIAELIDHRVRAGHPSAKALYNEYYDTDH